MSKDLDKKQPNVGDIFSVKILDTMGNDFGLSICATRKKLENLRIMNSFSKLSWVLGFEMGDKQSNEIAIPSNFREAVLDFGNFVARVSGVKLAQQDGGEEIKQGSIEKIYFEVVDRDEARGDVIEVFEN